MIQPYTLECTMVSRVPLSLVLQFLPSIAICALNLPSIIHPNLTTSSLGRPIRTISSIQTSSHLPTSSNLITRPHFHQLPLRLLRISTSFTTKSALTFLFPFPPFLPFPPPPAGLPLPFPSPFSSALFLPGNVPPTNPSTLFHNSRSHLSIIRPSGTNVPSGAPDSNTALYISPITLSLASSLPFNLSFLSASSSRARASALSATMLDRSESMASITCRCCTRCCEYISL